MQEGERVGAMQRGVRAWCWCVAGVVFLHHRFRILLALEFVECPIPSFCECASA